MNKPLILIDANNVCHIALHTMGELSHLEMKTGVAFGLFSKILKFSEEFGSNRFVLCWDSRKRLRCGLYPEYKSNREDPKKQLLSPEERRSISEQMEALHSELLPAFGFSNSFRCTGFEGDDVIAQAVLQYPEEFIIVSTDKDLLQMLAIAAVRFVYNPVTKKRIDRKVFRESYGIEPHQWVQAKSLMGDAGDNVPGVPGIGLKSAVDFIHGRLKGKKLKAIEESAEVIARNELLVRLPFRPVPVPKTLGRDNFSEDKMVEIFDRLGFQSFLRGDNLVKWREFING